MSVRGVKGKEKKRKPIKPDNPAQSARFIESAKAIGADGKAFEKAMDKLVPKKKRVKLIVSSQSQRVSNRQSSIRRRWSSLSYGVVA